MVNITKVYTRTGDQGQTALAAGRAIAKDSARINVMGEVDELNATLGFAAAALNELKDVQTHVLVIQNELFNLGAQLAVLPQDRRPNTPMVKHTDTARLELEMDRMNVDLPSLTSFILPGGGEVSARLHLARTVCRRAERSLVRLIQAEAVADHEVILPYLNRLSD